MAFLATNLLVTQLIDFPYQRALAEAKARKESSAPFLLDRCLPWRWPDKHAQSTLGSNLSTQLQQQNQLILAHSQCFAMFALIAAQACEASQHRESSASSVYSWLGAHPDDPSHYEHGQIPTRSGRHIPGNLRIQERSGSS